MVDDAAIGKLLREYNANETELESFQEQFQGIAKQVSELDQLLSIENPSVQVTETHFQARIGEVRISRDLLNALAECLNGLERATTEKARLESCIKHVGLPRFIQQPAEQPQGLSGRTGF